MNIHELRITNLVQFGSQPSQVGAALYETQLYTPIELTPELLERFGFIQLSKSVWKKNEIIVMAGREIKAFVGEFEIVVNHVHTLQNLYFALIGKELELI